MTKHPCHGRSKAQIEAFEQIATGTALPATYPKTLEALERAGLIQRLPDKIVGRDAFGAIALPQYQVPIRHHAQWCAWCAENVMEEG